MADKKAKGGKEAEAPEADAEGAEGAPKKKKLAGRTLVLFIILPALLVIGGGGAGAMMLLGGKPADSAEAAELAHGEAKPPADAKKKDEKKDAGKGGHGAAGGAAEGDPADIGWLKAGAEGDPSYWHMPKIIVNLATAEDQRPLFLELQLVLEAGEAHTFDHVPVLMPRMKDQLQAFLRELRVEDLNGSAGSYRLRLELLKRFNLVMAPEKIDAVLIEGILIQ